MENSLEPKNIEYIDVENNMNFCRQLSCIIKIGQAKLRFSYLYDPSAKSFNDVKILILSDFWRYLGAV